MHSLAEFALTVCMLASVAGALIVCVLIAIYGLSLREGQPEDDRRRRRRTTLGRAAAATSFTIAATAAVVALTASPAADKTRPPLQALQARLADVATALERIGSATDQLAVGLQRLLLVGMSTSRDDRQGADNGASDTVASTGARISARPEATPALPPAAELPALDRQAASEPATTIISSPPPPNPLRSTSPGVLSAALVERGVTPPAASPPTERPLPTTLERSGHPERPTEQREAVIPSTLPIKKAPPSPPPPVSLPDAGAAKVGVPPPPVPAEMVPPRIGRDADDVQSGPGQGLSSVPPAQNIGPAKKPGQGNDGADDFDKPPRGDRPAAKDDGKQDEGSDGLGPGRSYGGDRLDKTGTDETDKSDKVDKTDKVEKTDKIEKTDKVDKVDKPEKIDKVDKPEKVEKVDKPQKVEKVEKVDKPEAKRGR